MDEKEMLKLLSLFTFEASQGADKSPTMFLPSAYLLLKMRENLPDTTTKVVLDRIGKFFKLQVIIEDSAFTFKSEYLDCLEFTSRESFTVP